MINQEYIQELKELGGYIFEQIDIPDLSSYLPYITSIGAAIIIFIIALKIFNRRRAVREYISDGVCLKIQLQNAENREKEIITILGDIHEELYRLYKYKYHFAIELLQRDRDTTFFLVLPQNIFFSLRETTLKKYTYDVVTAQRERFIEQLHDGVKGVILELQKDFVFPLKFQATDDTTISLGTHDWIFSQIVCRAKDLSWKKALERYRSAMSKGRKPSSLSTGCCGGCLSVAEPFFSFLASLITTSVHGTVEDSSIGKKRGEKKYERELSLFDEKNSLYGFEVSVRVFSRSTVEDRAYAILDSYLSKVTTSEEDYNAFVVSRVIEKVNRNTQNDLILAYLAKNCVDVINEKEIAEITTSMY